jgi:hypothetical protein
MEVSVSFAILTPIPPYRYACSDQGCLLVHSRQVVQSALFPSGAGSHRAGLFLSIDFIVYVGRRVSSPNIAVQMLGGIVSASMRFAER